MLDRYASQEAKSKVIEETVRSYFQENALETWEGQVRCGEVLSAVKSSVKDALGAKARMTKYNKGEVWDAIREFGPEGENDAKWLAIWGGRERMSA